MDKLSYEEADKLLEDFCDAKSEYEDMLNRVDWVEWSQEAEDKASKEYYSLRDKIIELMTK